MTEEAPPLRRAIILMTASSVAVPAVGLLTQPILARALGAAGRGELVAAMAPAVLLGSVATLGLPDALTYLYARGLTSSRRAVVIAMSLSVAMGLICIGVTLALAPWLAAGDEDLARLMTLSTVLAVPAFALGAVRGAARGKQAWNVLAWESVLTSLLRFSSFLLIWLVWDLTVELAVLVSMIAPVLAGVVYLRMLHRRGRRPQVGGFPRAVAVPVVRPLVTYGLRAWFGSVAGMLVARTAQILIVPLSDTRELGLFAVATTVSDVPVIVAMAVAGALQGVSSRSNDPGEVTGTARSVLLLSLLGCTVLGGTLPFWIDPVFGREFHAAVVPTLGMLLSAVISIPGLMTASGLAAFGRPGLRSTGFALTFVVNAVTLWVLVPGMGAVGASLSAIVTSAAMSVFMVLAASRVMDRPASEFVVPQGADLRRLLREGSRFARRLSPWTRTS